MNNCDGPQRQRPMSSRQLVHVVAFPISRLVPMKTRAIPRDHPSFYKSDRIPRKAVNRTGSCGATLVEEGAQSDDEYGQRSKFRERHRPHRSKLVEGLVA